MDLYLETDIGRSNRRSGVRFTQLYKEKNIVRLNEKYYY